VWGIYEGVPGEGGAPNQYTGEASAMGTGKNIHEPKAEGRIFAGRICEMPSEPADDKAAGGGGRGEHRMGPNPRMAGLRPPLLPRGGEGIGAVPSTAYIRPRGGQRGRGRPTRQGAPEEGAGPRGYRANTYREPGGVKGQRVDSGRQKKMAGWEKDSLESSGNSNGSGTLAEGTTGVITGAKDTGDESHRKQG